MIPELIIYTCAFLINYLTLRYHLNLRTKGSSEFTSFSPVKDEANLSQNTGYFQSTSGDAKEWSGDQERKSSLQTPFLPENDPSHERGKLATYVKDEEEEAAITSIPPSPVEERTRYDDVEVGEDLEDVEDAEEDIDDESESNPDNIDSEIIEINQDMENSNKGEDILFSAEPQILPSQIEHTADYQGESSTEPVETEETLPPQHPQPVIEEIEDLKTEDESMGNKLALTTENTLIHHDEEEDDIDIQPIDSSMWESFVTVEPNLSEHDSPLIPAEIKKTPEQEHSNSFFDNQTTENNVLDTDLVTETEFKPSSDSDTAQELTSSSTDIPIENTGSTVDTIDLDEDEDESTNEVIKDDKASDRDDEIGDSDERHEAFENNTTENYSENEQLEIENRKDWETQSLEDEDEETQQDEDEEDSIPSQSWNSLEVDDDENDEDLEQEDDSDPNKGQLTMQELMVED